MIAFCGIDGSGKTTQLHRLRERMEARGYDLLVTRQPSDWYRGDRVVRAFLDERIAAEDVEAAARELALFAAADRMRLGREVLAPALSEGKLILSDRSVISTYTYFLARGIRDIDWLMAINRFALVPDVVVYLDVDPEVAIERIRHRGLGASKSEELNLERMRAVREGFLDQPWGPGYVRHYLVLDGTREEAELEDHIWSLLEPMLPAGDERDRKAGAISR